MWERHYNHYVKSVMKSAKPARAEVVSAEPAPGHRVGENTGDVSWGWNMALKVTPEVGDPFDLSVKMEIPILMDPVHGTILQVFYNPDKPEKIVVDPASVPKNKRDAVVAAAIDIEHSMGAETTGMKEAAEGISDPIKAAEAASAQAGRNVAANRDAMIAEVDRVRAEQGNQAAEALVASNTQAMLSQVQEARARAGLPPVDPSQLVVPPAVADPTAAVQAKLEDLDRLRDAGVLDEQNYQASRKRLIDSV
jgi:hypothetical protein